MWLVGNESVKYRLGVLNEIKHRNVEDIKIVSVDGLTRFGDTIDVVFPPTEIQRPSGTLHYEVCELQRFQALCKGFERSLSGCNRWTGARNLNALEEKWDKKYHSSVASCVITGHSCPHILRVSA